jgi:hypothetical protein
MRRRPGPDKEKLEVAEKAKREERQLKEQQVKRLAERKKNKLRLRNGLLRVKRRKR